MKKEMNYGNLQKILSDAALRTFEETDPLKIFAREIEEDDGTITTTYDVRGAFEASDLTAEKLDALLSADWN